MSVRIYSPPLFNLTIKEVIMMKSKLLNSLILAALVVPSVAMAEEKSPFSGNVSLTTDYLYRGITQTNHRGAIQGGFDYADPSGFYIGTWGSNISWIPATGSSLELDTYAGYSGGFATDFTYNVGVLRYNYSGEYAPPSPNTNEVYGSIGWKMLTAKYSRSLTNLFGFADSSGAGYLELNAAYSLEGPGVDLSAHYGKQTIPNNTSAEYSDYNVKAAKSFGAYTWAFMVSNTNLTGYDKARGVLSVSHSM
jgi:uncharacterized protein (TIGR02001 family)